MRKLEPKISIIIPIYNAEKYIEECLYSIMKQTFCEIEIICVDDGSSDNSMEIVSMFAQNDMRIRTLGSSKENYGQAHARNCGIEEATGEYIFFIDADDMLATNETLEILYKTAKSDNLDGVIFDSTGFFETEEAKSLFKGDVVKFRVNSNMVCSGKCLFSQAILSDGYTSVVWQQFWKTEHIKKNKLFFCEDTSPWEDLLFTFKAFVLTERMMHIPKVLYKYRYQENSSSMGSYTLKKFYSHFRCYYEAIRFLESQKIRVSDVLAYTRYLNQIKNILRDRAVSLMKKELDVSSISFFTATEKLFLQLLLTEEYTYMTSPLTLNQYRMLSSASLIIVYGAGEVGKDAMKLLYRYGFLEFVFAVTNKKEGREKAYNITLEEIEELKEYRNTAVVILAASKLYRTEMEENLKRLGFFRYFCVE